MRRAGANDIVTQTNYNRVNQPETLLGPAYLSPSHTYGALASADAAERIIQTAYDDDPLLRVSRVIPPGHDQDNAVDTRYGSWGIESGQGRSFRTVDDEKGTRTTSVYDGYGRMRYAIADSAGTDAATRNNRTSFVYDALDRLTSTTMPGGGTSRYAYDTLGRMTSRHHPDADGPIRYKYDDLGRVRFSQDARQRAVGTGNATEKITFTVYDAFGRVIRVGETAATFASLDPESAYPFERDNTSWRTRMTYDDGDAAGGGPNYAQGRLVKVEENTDSDSAAEVTHLYAYDHLGNVRVKQVEIDGLTGDRTVEYVHDLAGRVTRLIYPNGAQARYAYDSAGRLSRVGDAQGKTLAAYTHTAAGNIDTHIVGATHTVGDVAGDGIVTGAYTYNARDWVTDMNYTGKFKSALTYDHVGNITRQVYRHGSDASITADYDYDDLYRITDFDVSGGASQDYAYDKSGNITSLVTGTTTLTYNYTSASTPNRLDSTNGTGGESYSYNENGSVTSVGGSTLSYDYRGLVTGYGGSHTYTRDSEGYRVKKTGSGGITYYLRGVGGAVLAEYNSGGTLTSSYFYAGGDRLARLANDAMHYYLKDHLGSTRTLLSSSGTTEAAYDYWPYGEILASSGADATPFKFTGHERDTESGFDFMQYRTYEPDRMRFLQLDPRAEKYPGLSPYAYAGNNPLKFIDARGDTLDVGGLNKGQTALSYLQSMVDKETAKRITMGKGGRVSFDSEGIDLSQDSAVELVNNLVNSSEKYLFVVDRTAEGVLRNNGKDGITREPIRAGESSFTQLNANNLGIRVYSRTPRNVGGVGVGEGLLPKHGYGGQVVLAPGSWTSNQGNLIPVGDVTFHELSEAYYRTDKGMAYPQAHGRALRDAERHKNRGVPPSVLDRGVNFELAP